MATSDSFSGAPSTDVDELIHTWGNTPIMSNDAFDTDGVKQQSALLKRDIITLYEDYRNISKNAGSSRLSIKAGIVDRVNADPTGFFDGLAAFALSRMDDLNIRDVLKASNVAEGSLMDLSIVFENWYCLIMGTNTPHVNAGDGKSSKGSILRDPVRSPRGLTSPSSSSSAAGASFKNFRPPALLTRHGTDSSVVALDSSRSSVRWMDQSSSNMDSVRSEDYKNSNFIVSKPSWEHGSRGRHDFMCDDPNDPTVVVLPPVDSTGLVSPDSTYFRNILGDHSENDGEGDDIRMKPDSEAILESHESSQNDTTSNSTMTVANGTGQSRHQTLFRTVPALPPSDAPVTYLEKRQGTIRSIPSKDMDDDEFYANLEEVTNIIACNSWDDYGGRYDTVSPRRKTRNPDGISWTKDATPLGPPTAATTAAAIVSDSEPSSCSSDTGSIFEPKSEFLISDGPRRVADNDQNIVMTKIATAAITGTGTEAVPFDKTSVAARSIRGGKQSLSVIVPESSVLAPSGPESTASALGSLGVSGLHLSPPPPRSYSRVENVTTSTTSTTGATTTTTVSGDGNGTAPVPNVQRRKRRKLMDIVEVLSDGTKVSRTILAPKGIYKTPHGFRVQLNIEPIIDESGNQSASAKRGKFSRNAKNFEDAMWVYEVAILISDCPSDVQTMLIRGNFESMLSMSWFNTTSAYMYNLENNIKKLHSIKILNATEYNLAIASLEQVSTEDETIPAIFLDPDGTGLTTTLSDSAAVPSSKFSQPRPHTRVDRSFSPGPDAVRSSATSSGPGMIKHNNNNNNSDNGTGSSNGIASASASASAGKATGDSLSSSSSSVLQRMDSFEYNIRDVDDFQDFKLLDL